MTESITNPVAMAKCGFTLLNCLVKECNTAVQEITPVSNEEVIESLKDIELMINNADNGIIEVIKEVS